MRGNVEVAKNQGKIVDGGEELKERKDKDLVIRYRTIVIWDDNQLKARFIPSTTAGTGSPPAHETKGLRVTLEGE